MLCRLSIKNLILVQSCDISFSEGFSILTGESGAGKSVVASAILLLLGAKCETAQIRTPAECASVEGSFYPVPEKVREILHEIAIGCEDGEELIICRELFTSGKSKSFVNNRPVTAAILKKIAPFLVSFCGQHAHMELFNPESSLALVDRFAQTTDAKKEFQHTHVQLLELRKEIQAIEGQTRDRNALLEIAAHQISEIEALGLKSGEDEALYARFCELNASIELSETIGQISDQLEAASLARLKPLFDKLVKQSSRSQALYDHYAAILSELKELAYELSRCRHYPDEIQHELKEIQGRLSLIDSIKKKFGKTVEEVLIFKEEREELLKKLQELKLHLEELKEKAEALQVEEDALAKKLTVARKKQAPVLSQLLTNELASLNMPGSVFEIELESCSRTVHGDEKVFCYIQVNKGLSRALVQDAASGGELSRIILACKTVLIGDDDPACLIFDEIDANIGGETASIVGQKLLALSRGRQVLAITHFPQVAATAEHHYLISKKEEGGSTVTQIQLLDSESEREREFSRMLGVTQGRPLHNLSYAGAGPA